MTLTTGHRICPLCEAMCGLEVTLDGPRDSVRGDPDACSARASSARRASTSARSTPTPTGSRRRCCDPGRPLVRSAGTRPSRPSAPGFDRVRDEHGRESFALYRGNPSAHTFAAVPYLRGADRVAGHAAALHREHRRPDAGARRRRRDLRQPDVDPRARHRPHRLPADARRQPDGVQRQPVHRTRLPAARSRARRPRWPAGGRRPDAAPRPPAVPTGTWRSARAPTLLAARACCRNSPPPAGSTPGPARGPLRRRRRAARAGRALHAGGVAGGRADPADDISAVARELAARTRRRGLRPHRHLHDAGTARWRSG